MKNSSPLSNFLLSQVAPESPSLLTRAPPAKNLAKGPKANFSVSNQRSLLLTPLSMAHKWPLSPLETVFPGLLGDPLPHLLLSLSGSYFAASFSHIQSTKCWCSPGLSSASVLCSCPPLAIP